MNPNFNRLGNSHNHYQGSAKRVLCVCSAGLLRSPTAANVLHSEYGYNTRACGVSEEYALIVLDEVLLEWADEVVFMDSEHYKAAHAKFPEDVDSTTAYILGVPDRYVYMDSNLQKIILKQYQDAVMIHEATK